MLGDMGDGDLSLTYVHNGFNVQAPWTLRVATGLICGGPPADCDGSPPSAARFQRGVNSPGYLSTAPSDSRWVSSFDS